MKIGIISLGCPRNLVDSEVMLGKLKEKGYVIKEEIPGCDIALINTCAFIEDAKQESIDIILQAAELKKEGKVKKIIVAGCLPQRYLDALSKQITEIDAFLGISDFDSIADAVESVINEERFIRVGEPVNVYSHKNPRFFLTPSSYTYVKIAEGCNNRCSYCVIYKIKGSYRSRPFPSIIKEINGLTAKKDIPELNIIAQDTTSYGRDIYGEYRLAKLLKEISHNKKIHWIRLLYTHPRHFTDELIDVIADTPSICKYIDLPIQHINNKILKGMSRKITRERIEKLIKKIRDRIPDVALRSSIIVGFPGETNKEFKELLQFLKAIKFERLGAFIYSREENTLAYAYKNQASDKEKRTRFDEVMKTQQEISLELNKRLLGGTIEVLIEEPLGGTALYAGRSQHDAPEVDGIVYVSGKGLRPGKFKMVEITDTFEYDLKGRVSKI